MSDIGRITGSRPIPTQSAAAGAETVTTVRQGEQSLSSVSTRLGVSTESLKQANPQIKNPDQLKVGQELFLPGKKGPDKPAATSTSAQPRTTVMDSKTQKSDLQLTGQLARARLSNTASTPQTELTGGRKFPSTEAGKSSQGGFQTNVSVDVGKMHASAEFGSKDLKNGVNSVVDAVEHPANVLKHAEEDISNAAEVEANQILYGRVPQLPVGPNPVFDALDAMWYNPTAMKVSDEVMGGAINGLIDGGTALDEGLKHAGRQVTNAERHAAGQVGKAISNAENKASDAWGQASDAASNATDAASSAATDAADAVGDAASGAADAVDDIF